jgi:hypothetical protein
MGSTTTTILSHAVLDQLSLAYLFPEGKGVRKTVFLFFCFFIYEKIPPKNGIKREYSSICWEKISKFQIQN